METFSALLAICAGNSPVPVKSPHKGQWRGALMFSLISSWINSWVKNREAGDLRRNRAHYDVIVMISASYASSLWKQLGQWGLDPINGVHNVGSIPSQSQSVVVLPWLIRWLPREVHKLWHSWGDDSGLSRVAACRAHWRETQLCHQISKYISSTILHAVIIAYVWYLNWIFPVNM